MSARVLGCAAALLFALATTPLVAHMSLAKANPAADGTVSSSPSTVQLWFTQAPDPAVSKLEIVGPDGKAIALTGVHTMADKSLMGTVPVKLGDGKYTVRWQAAGDDGHVQKGEYAFTVKLAQ